MKWNTIKAKITASEGLSPIYKDGVITPGTRGLGPKNESNKYKIMPPSLKVKPRVDKQPRIRNIKNLA